MHRSQHSMGTKEPPVLIGFRKGMERYANLYDQAIKFGAIPEKSLDPKKQKQLKRKQMLIDSGRIVAGAVRRIIPLD